MNALLMLVVMCLGQVGGGGEPDELEALVKRIRENLTRVDNMLLESANADDVASGIKGVVDTHVQVIRDLEDLIKQMKYTPSSMSSPGSSGESPGSPSSQPPPRESDGSESQESGQGEQPQSPQEQAESESQEGGQEDQQDQQGQSEGENTPQDGMADSSAPQQQQGGPPPPDTIGNFTREDTDQRWGLLPPKLQERLLNLHVDDVPEQYRLWLEAYIRRMHALETGGSR